MQLELFVYGKLSLTHLGIALINTCIYYTCMYHIVCGGLSNLANGNVITTGRIVGDTARYYCNYGYYLIGNDTITCQSSGNWSEPPPFCEG